MPREPMPRSGPRAGDILWVDGRASVQFGGDRAIWFRVIRLHDWSTYDGWCWLDGYELEATGDAVARRSIFVQVGGLCRVDLDRPRARRAPASNERRFGPARAGQRVR